MDYPLLGPQHDIPQFAQPEPEALQDTTNGPDRKRYEWTYQRDAGAAQYDRSFSESRRKRQRTRRELWILERLLSDQPTSKTLLDIPCGGGRLSAPMAARTHALLEADISPAQLDLALTRNYSVTCPVGMVVSALELPLPDESIDGVICARLSHHLPDAKERETLLGELLRVSKNFVIFSFTDRRSIQSISRRIRGRALKSAAMLPEEIAAIASRYGARLDQCLTVSNLGSRHRYALLVKN